MPWSSANQLWHIGGLWAICQSNLNHAKYHELRLRGLEVMPRREFQVFYRGRPIGGIKFNHLQVGDSLMVFPVAIQDVNDLSINNLKAWMHVQKVPLAIIANFYPDKLDFMVLRTEQENTDAQDKTDKKPTAKL